jgi:catechol 2,3-dioxygenase-like lactoylglutathione lyase family enzyme
MIREWQRRAGLSSQVQRSFRCATLRIFAFMDEHRNNMQQTIVPMLHVPDVRATIDWYTSIGFKLIRHNEEDGEINWASLSFGNSEIMLNSGGKQSADHRREVDLYVHTDNLDDVYGRIKNQVEIVEDPHDNFLRYA